MKIYYCCCFITWSFCLNLFSQDQESIRAIEYYVADIYEQYTDETGEELDFDSFYEELMTLVSKPVNLNNTSREELEKLPFLSDIQIENIMYYVYKFGPIRTIYELQLIEGFDMTDIRYMLPFVIVGDKKEKSQSIKFNEIFHYGKNEILCLLSKGLENKTGYLHFGNDSLKYKGNNLYNYVKYRFQYKDRVQINFTTEKDAGEKGLKVGQIAYDFYSVSLQLKNIGCIQNIIVGDYQAQFGQGMVIKQAFATGKSSMTTHLMSIDNGFKCFRSTNEFNFLRGTAVSFQHKNLKMHLFYSNKLIDGEVQANSFSGFYKTGYHRTESEIQKKNKVQQILYGGNITFTGRTYQLGITPVYMQLSHNMKIRDRPYNYFYFRGNNQLVTGLNYRIRWNKFNFFGETAITNKAYSTLNGGTFSPIPRANIAFLYRNYAPAFNAVFASAFSEGSCVSNERGFYFGVEVTPFKFWKLAAYADSYQFPWIKYDIDVPSIGKDFLFQASYSPSNRIDMFWRFKYEDNEQNRSGTIHPVAEIENNRKSSLRYQLVCVSGDFTVKNIIEGNIVKKGNDPLTYGLAALQELSFNCKIFPLSVDVRYLFFDAVNYDNRIYTFEKDVLYVFSSPNFSGLGNRYYINLRCDLNKNLSCWIKFSQNIFADERENLGSGNELIHGNKKTEIKCLVRWKFSNY
ncbi:MAG: helix-hairpin-helix domain-containing protein [Paludibacter sp.]|nr:helix-hairpin-helix domain-containing protein [Paludibacter sp.]